MDFTVHLGGNYHASVKSWYSTGKYQNQVCSGGSERTLTKTGIALAFLHWEKIKNGMIFVEEHYSELDKAVQ